MIIKVWSESGFNGADREDEIEMPDEASDEDCEEATRDWFFNYNNYGWQRK